MNTVICDLWVEALDASAASLRFTENIYGFLHSLLVLRHLLRCRIVRAQLSHISYGHLIWFRTGQKTTVRADTSCVMSSAN